MRIINRILNNQDNKNLVKNFGYLSILQIASYVFPLITIPYLAKTIGAEGFGKVAFASAIMTWIQTITDWGFGYTATRDVAQNRNDKNSVSDIFSNVLWARLSLCFISGLLLSLLIIFIPQFNENKLILLISFLLVPGHILFPEWFFQAVEKMKYTTLFNVLIKLIFTIAVFIFIKQKEDYWIQPLLTSIGFIICGIGAFYIIVAKWKYKIYAPNIRNIVKTIRSSTDVFINSLMPNFYNNFSIILLGFWGGSVANGIFDGGSKFVNIIVQFQSMLSRVFFPFLSRRKDKHYIYAKINIGSSVVGALILIIFSPFITKYLLGNGFEKSIYVMNILAISLIFMAMSNTYGANYLIIHFHERELRNITITSSFIGMIIAVPLVMHFSYIGAACVITICRLLLGLLSYLQVRKIKRNL